MWSVPLERVAGLDHGDADGRVREGVQVGPRGVVGEGHRGQGGPVDGPVGRQYPLAETVDQRLIGRATRRHHVPGHLVGVDEIGPAVDQEVGHGRLSRPDAPGKADRQHRRMVVAIPGAANEARYAAQPVMATRASRQYPNASSAHSFRASARLGRLAGPGRRSPTSRRS